MTLRDLKELTKVADEHGHSDDAELMCIVTVGGSTDAIGVPIVGAGSVDGNLMFKLTDIDKDTVKKLLKE